MSQPLTVTVSHTLGREEALRRVSEGVRWAVGKYGHWITIQQEDWSDQGLTFRISALGQSAAGSILVSDKDATVSVQLPWLLARFADKAQAALRHRGQVLLEKK